jgi:hypothetical protein
MPVLCEPCEEREPETYKSTQCAKSLNIDVDNLPDVRSLHLVRLLTASASRVAVRDEYELGVWA